MIGIGGTCNLFGIHGIALIGIGGPCSGPLDVRHEVNLMGQFHATPDQGNPLVSISQVQTIYSRFLKNVNKISKST